MKVKKKPGTKHKKLRKIGRGQAIEKFKLKKIQSLLLTTNQQLVASSVSVRLSPF